MVKDDCFGFVDHSSLRAKAHCDALKRLYCKVEDCKFYKSKEQYKAEDAKRRKEQA